MLFSQMVLLADPTAGDPVDILRAKRAHDRKYVFDWAFDEHSTQVSRTFIFLPFYFSNGHCKPSQNGVSRHKYGRETTASNV